MKTRKLALSLAAVLVLALVAPVVGQPFADVPTNHWAYDAIAELAAKGLVEGFPDGTFKGNQPLTRYEMAMIVARIIARIEAIPTPPPPEVRRADLDAVRRDLTAATGRIAASERTIATLQRLVNEFRAELQALGVRVTALEEELSALRARLDNTRITGLFDASYIAPGTATALAGTPLVGNLAGPLYTFGAADIWPRIRLQYTGSVAPGVSVFLRSRYYSTVGGAHTVDFDRAYITVDNLFDVERLQLRAGRDTVTLGPIGLLLDEGNGNDRRTGVYVRWSLDPISLLGFVQWQDAAQANPATVVGGRLAFALLPGWTLGVNARSDALNGAAPAAPAAGAGRSDGFGWSADLSGDLLAGLRLTAEYANYRNDTFSTTSNYWQVQAALDFATLFGVEALSPKLTLWYKDFDPLNIPRPRANLRSPDFYPSFYFTPNLRAFGARLDLKLLDNLTAWALGEWGNFKTPLVAPYSGDSWNLWEGGLTWTVAPRVDVTLFYVSSTAGGLTVQQAAGLYAATRW
ncbi:MAG: S-layer homology domain-containing protein [Armatimonadota bacterium]|nr:S-layer homology domain-containing protein [Armatimonadota bacterium]